MLTDKMRTAFGYDMYGNSPLLLAAHDKKEIERGINRAGGEVVCTNCGCSLNLHPKVQGALYLTRTCTYGIVKL